MDGKKPFPFGPFDSRQRIFSENSIVEDGEFGLKLDTVQPGDTTFAHAERTVLAIEAQLSDALADKRLDLHVEDDQPELVIVEQPLE